MKLPKPESLIFIGIIIAAASLFMLKILGLSAMMSVIGIVLLLILPMYFILDNFDLSDDEKIVFSFFLGAGVFPIFTYWIGMIISFRLAILITFLILVGAGIIIRRSRKK